MSTILAHHRGTLAAHRLLRLLGAAWVLVWSVRCLAAPPQPDSLAHYVPADVGLFVELRDATARAQRFLAGPMYARIAAQRGFRRWADESAHVFRQLSQELAARLEVDEHELWEAVLGRRAALALWPPQEANGQADARARPAIALLCDAGRETAAEKLLSGLRTAAAQKRGVRLEQARWAGQTYWTVHNAADAATPRVHLAASASLVMVCDDQQRLRRLLEIAAAGRSRTQTPPDTLAALSDFAAAAELWPDGLLLVFVQPRVWEALLAAEAERAPPDQAADRRHAVAVCQAIQYIALSADVQPQLRADLVIQLRPSALTDEAREVLRAFSGPSAALPRVPSDCLAAVCTRVDLARLLRVAAQQAAPGSSAPDWAALLVLRALGQLGPDAALYLTTAQPSTSATGGDFPLVAVAAVGIAAHSELSEPALRSLLQDALPGLLQWNSADGTAQGAVRLHTAMLDGVKITSLTNAPQLPRGMQPAYAVRDGWLWGSSTPQGLLQAIALPQHSLAQRVATGHLAPSTIPPNHVLYLNAAALRAVLQRHGARIVAELAAARQMESHELHRGLDRLVAGLHLVDAAWLAVRVQEDRLAASLVLQVDEAVVPATQGDSP